MRPRPRRRYGTGSLYRLPNGRWRAQVAYRRADGRRRQISRDVATEEDARRSLDRLLEQLGRDHDPSDRQTLGAYLGEWLVGVGPSVRPRTIQSYRGLVTLHVDPLIGGIYLDRLRPSDIGRLIADRLASGLSPTSVTRVLAVLSMALAAAVRDGVLPRNVARVVRWPKVERHEIAALSVSAARRIVAATADDSNAALYVLLLGSGMRIGEAVALDWADIDLAGATVRIRTGKTARARRVIPIPGVVVTALRAHQARTGRLAGAAFLGERTGDRLRADSAYHRFRQLLDAAGLPPMRIHDLRHGAATLMLAGGMDMRYLADQLGHADPSLTARVYAHVIPELQREGVQRLDEVLG